MPLSAMLACCRADACGRCVLGESVSFHSNAHERGGPRVLHCESAATTRTRQASPEIPGKPKRLTKIVRYVGAVLLARLPSAEQHAAHLRLARTQRLGRVSAERALAHRSAVDRPGGLGRGHHLGALREALRVERLARWPRLWLRFLFRVRRGCGCPRRPSREGRRGRGRSRARRDGAARRSSPR